MGLFRGGLLSVVCILLFLSFLIGNVLLILSLSLDYQVLEKGTISVGTELLREQIGQEVFLIQEFCLNNTEYVFNATDLGKTIVFPCKNVSFDSNSIIEYGVKDFLKQTYYDSYACGFWSCLGQGNAFVLISQKAQDYWKSKFYFVLIISVVLVALAFLLIENKFNLPIIVGGLLALSSVPLNKLNSLLLFLIPKSFESLISVLIIKSSIVAKGVLVIGIVLIVLGVLLRFVGIGFIKKHFSKKEVEEIVKEEVKKAKKQEKPKEKKAKDNKKS